MAIQHRRGAEADFLPEKMLPAEFAVSTDGTRKVWIAFGPNDVREVAFIDDLLKSGYYYPTIDIDGNLVWMPTLDGMPDAAKVNIKGLKGDTGGYYIPTIDDEGNLTWSASMEGMPKISGTNIMGPEGPEGPRGENGTTPHIGENGNWFIGDVDTGVPSQGSGGGTVTEQVQSDYAQTDDSDPSYIKNKIVGDILDKDSDTLSWDGNTEGLEQAAVGNMILYLVHETPLTIGEGIEVTYNFNGDEKITTITQADENGFVSIDDWIASVPTDDYNPTVYPKKGIYFLEYLGTYIENLTIPGYTGLPGIKIKKLEAKYLPDEALQTVKYTEQTLEEAQQTQARENIGAASKEELQEVFGKFSDYYLKKETYSQTEINQKLSAIPKFAITVVDSLPITGDDATVYLVKNDGSGDNLYDEYIYVNGAWEYLGSQTVDLSGYAKKATTLAGYGITDGATKDEVTQLSEEIDDQDNATQDTAIFGNELVTSSDWTLGTGWSGSLANGFTHASGNTEPLTFNCSTFATGKLFEVSFKSSVAMTIDNLFVSVGNSKQFNLYGQQKDGKISVGVLAIDSTGLVFTPSSTYTGTITNISVKEIIGSYEAVQQYFDTNEAVAFEIRVTKSAQENVFIGKNAGQMNTSGFHNVALGDNALETNTSGFWNIAIGKKTLNRNTVGSRNVGIGYNALLNNEAGQRNIAIGTFAMTQMTNGNKNVAIGADSMNKSTGGDDNVGVGFNTLGDNTGDNNTGIGSDVLGNNTGGDGNTGIGNKALHLNTTGNYNAGVGANACYYNTTGNYNVGVGANALYKNKTGKNNVALGFNAGRTLVIGNGNIVIGAEVDIADGSNYVLNIGNLLKGSVQSGSAYLDLNGGLRLPFIPTAYSGTATEVWNNNGVLMVGDGGMDTIVDAVIEALPVYEGEVE